MSWCGSPSSVQPCRVSAGRDQTEAGTWSRKEGNKESPASQMEDSSRSPGSRCPPRCPREPSRGLRGRRCGQAFHVFIYLDRCFHLPGQVFLWAGSGRGRHLPRFIHLSNMWVAFSVSPWLVEGSRQGPRGPPRAPCPVLGEAGGMGSGRPQLCSLQPRAGSWRRVRDAGPW